MMSNREHGTITSKAVRDAFGAPNLALRSNLTVWPTVKSIPSMFLT
jgi:hypothetical protein